MDVDKRVEWLLPNRIMKLVSGFKSSVCGKRLFIIGIGADGIDVLLGCKDFAEKHFEYDNSRIRFLGIDTADNLKAAERCGSVLTDSEQFDIDPEQAIYPYLNDPDRLPEPARAWFDEGLFNYTQNKPVYGEKKRQCARLCVFHYADELIKRLRQAYSGFSKSDIPLEIVLTGNLGDPFFGGMAIDIAYILGSIFGSDKRSVSICAHMLTADAAPLRGLNGRELAAVCANTVVAKSELDIFQCKRFSFNQSYSRNFSLKCDKPPFSECCLYSAEETFEMTVEKITVNVMCEYLSPQARDKGFGRADNMTDNHESRGFKYVTGVSIFTEIPFNSIFCYLSIKMLSNFNEYLSKNTIGDMELGMLKSKVCPDATLLASKAGDIPRLEFDENLNPLFSFKSLRRGAEASKSYVIGRLNQIEELCRSSSESYLNELYESITRICGEATADIKRGPNYAEQIVRGCMNALSERAEALRRTFGEIDESVDREEKILLSAHRRLKAPGFIAKHAVQPYIERIRSFAELKQTQLTGRIMVSFYDRLFKRFESYLNENLVKITNYFNGAARFLESGEILRTGSQCGFTRYAFDVSAPEVREAVERVADFSQDTMQVVFKRVNLKRLCSCDSKEFAREVTDMVQMCLKTDLQSMDFDRICEFFNSRRNLQNVLTEGLENISVTTPADSDEAVTRIVCPSNYKPKELVNSLRGAENVKSAANGSTMRFSAVVSQFKNGVRLDKFKDYDKWENMRYAYVNDSLKSQGIHIFRRSNKKN